MSALIKQPSYHGVVISGEVIRQGNEQVFIPEPQPAMTYRAQQALNCYEEQQPPTLDAVVVGIDVFV